jgi:hypothetical protein
MIKNVMSDIEECKRAVGASCGLDRNIKGEYTLGFYVPGPEHDQYPTQVRYIQMQFSTAKAAREFAQQHFTKVFDRIRGPFELTVSGL